MSGVTCRARCSSLCEHGNPTMRDDGEDYPMRQDGTFMHGPKHPAGSIVCNACYVAVGMPLNPVLEGAA